MMQDHHHFGKPPLSTVDQRFQARPLMPFETTGAATVPSAQATDFQTSEFLCN
jgi:hypothetical protein